MAKTKILKIDRREVTVEVQWDDGPHRQFIIPGVPVEDFELAHAFMTNYISSQYEAAVAEAAALAYANPTPAPAVLAAVGKSFDNDGNVVG